LARHFGLVNWVEDLGTAAGEEESGVS